MKNFKKLLVGNFKKLLVSITAADRINAPSKHFTLTVGDRELVAQNVIIIVQINTHIMTVILRYCGPFYDIPKHVYEVPKLRAFSRTSEKPAQITVFIGQFFGQLQVEKSFQNGS